MQTQDDHCGPHKTLKELPPSAKFVYKTLEQEGALTQSELADRTYLSIRTTRDAVTRLEEQNLIKTEYCPSDARKRVYSLQTG